MPTEEVLIVAKTEMKTATCVSAISNLGQGRRLLDSEGKNQSKTTLFEIGDIWEIDFEVPAKTALRVPHVEDIYVKNARKKQSKVAMLPKLNAMFEDNKLRAWSGHISTIFNGFLTIEASGSAYIEQSKGIPNQSTGFWILDQPLIHFIEEWDGKEKHYYQYNNSHDQFKVSYVGLESPIPTIKSGTLIRMSLARWWKRTPETPERCYLQLSGWYL
jgi:hypothetical protein